MNRYVRLTLDKLQGITADLVGMHNGWQVWNFFQLVEQAATNPFEQAYKPLYAALTLVEHSFTLLFRGVAIQNCFGK